MLNTLKRAIRSSWIPLLLVSSILAGSLIGHVWPSTGEALGGQVDRTLLALVGLLFFGVRFEAVFIFFVLTYFLGEGISRWTRLAHPEHALLTMSIAARNAPLMLAVTMAALPDQPLIHAALVIGMLVEFPHLTVLQRVLLGQRHHIGSPLPVPTQQP